MMQSRNDEFYWPLVRDGLTPDLVSFALPLSFGEIEEAFRVGMLSIPSLRDFLDHEGTTITPPSELLLIFLRTASTFDRQRDIEEELRRLASREQRKRPLWKVLAVLIVRRNLDEKSKLYVLEDLYQKFGAPTELAPYTLYGNLRRDPLESEPRSAKALIDELTAKLENELPSP